jgi:hypothetical protein
MAIVLALYFVHEGIVYFFPSRWISILTGTILFAGYFAFILRVERREFSRLPYLDKIPILRDLVALPAQRPAA